MTTLVAGTGLVGAHIVGALLARGESPVGLDRAPTDDNLRGLRGRFRLIEGDVLNLSLLIETIRTHAVDRIVTTVALVGPAAEASMYEAFRTNVTGAVNVLEAARLSGVKRVVFYSSNAIFDPAGTVGPFDEEAPKKPAGMNGAAKLCVESVGEIYASAHGIEFVSLRTGGIYGAGRSSGGLPQQLRECAECIAAGRSYTFEKYVYLGRTDLLEARDAAAAGILALDLRRTSRLTYNIGNGEAFSYEDLVEAIRVLYPQAHIDIRDGMRTPVRVGERAMDWTRARTDLGFTPTLPFARGFPELVAWSGARPAS